MAEILQNVGADVDTAVTRKTDYVIVGTKAGPKKLQLIEEYGIPILSEDEFIRKF
jgi:DNA polymerase-3 subunit epsilon